MLKALVVCPWVGQNEIKERQKWEVNRNLSVANICTKICPSLMVLSQLGIRHSYFGQPWISRCF
jgi:hypothetical protein